jgi:hypothetical protein
MKVIDLLVKRSKGEEVPKKIRIDHWCYKFEWVEHLDNYYDNSADIDLMSVLSMSKEELNYGVEIIEEEKKIELPEQLRTWRSTEGNFDRSRRWIDVNAEQYYEKINEILAYLKYKEEESKK